MRAGPSQKNRALAIVREQAGRRAAGTQILEISASLGLCEGGRRAGAATSREGLPRLLW